MTQKIGATIVTGFLGAGKTSLMRHLASAVTDRRLAFIINEFGDLGVDRAILEGCAIPGCADSDIIELANGCICCTVADDFLPALERVLDQPRPPDHILIETSGLALPKPLVQAFNWPGVKPRVSVDSVIAVIDAPAVLGGQFTADPAKLANQRTSDPALDHDDPLAELFADQLGVADLVVANKCEGLNEDAKARLDREVMGLLRPGVTMLHASHGRLPPDVLIGLGRAVEADLANRPTAHDGETHDHDDFTSFSMELGTVPDLARFAQALIPLILEHAILRIKGFVAVQGVSRRGVIQAAGPRIDHYFDRNWRAAEQISSNLVVIGLQGLDRPAILAAIQQIARNC